MTDFLAEPACFTLAAAPAEANEELRDLVRYFLDLQRFCECNGLTILCSSNMYAQIQAMPYARLDTAEHDTARILGARLNQFLDRHAKHHEWDGQDEEILRVEPVVSPAPALYCEPDLKMAWHDLLAQCVCKEVVPAMLLVDSERSFAPLNTSSVRIEHKDRRTFDSSTVYPLTPPPNLGLLCVADVEALESRIPAEPDEPGIVYEKSGHQPSDTIKQVLERTTYRVKGLVVRMNTSRRRRTGINSCKLRAAERYDQLEWTIYDGEQRFKGYFTTVATTANEQRVALLRVRAVYKRECEHARLPWNDGE